MIRTMQTCIWRQLRSPWLSYPDFSIGLHCNIPEQKIQTFGIKQFVCICIQYMFEIFGFISSMSMNFEWPATFCRLNTNYYCSIQQSQKQQTQLTSVTSCSCTSHNGKACLNHLQHNVEQLSLFHIYEKVQKKDKANTVRTRKREQVEMRRNQLHAMERSKMLERIILAYEMVFTSAIKNHPTV